MLWYPAPLPTVAAPHVVTHLVIPRVGFAAPHCHPRSPRAPSRAALLNWLKLSDLNEVELTQISQFIN